MAIKTWIFFMSASHVFFLGSNGQTVHRGNAALRRQSRKEGSSTGVEDLILCRLFRAGKSA